MNIILKGTTRIVIKFKKIVIKIPNFLYCWEHFIKGLLSNINENKTWFGSSIKDSYTYQGRHLICPVLWCSWGGWILIMKKANEINRIDWDSIDISEHKKYFEGDDTISNYGYLNNKVVKIDYGN